MPNRLAESSSPYLLQHADNPVDWRPWSREALDIARAEDKPIFLSIGYSACHWCHVMERESFENEETARIMNDSFVCIKVDREERPDLDEVYMRAVQMMTGSGGWPLSVFLTPELKPFFGGTYFPPEEKLGRPGFKRVLETVARAYAEKRADVDQTAQSICDALRSAIETRRDSQNLPLLEDIAEAVRQMRSAFDEQWGGFGSSPKFPSCPFIALLHRHHHRTGDEDALRMSIVTLDRMAHGGICDHIGGGFHRYSVDRQWLVPHFEKMLYDNAQLALVYLDAFQITGRPLYRRVATETLDYVLREMTASEGGFHSSQDADSEGEEGRFYVWTPGEIRRILGSEDADLLCRFYGVTEQGNFEGRNILHLPLPVEGFCKREGLEPEQFESLLADMRKRLLTERSGRVPPGKDDKILTDWNGLMISALARGCQVTGDDLYCDAAVRAAEFVLDNMRSGEGLLHAHRGGKSHVPGFLDDYVFLANSLLDLYESTFAAKWIDAAKELVAEMKQRFWDGAAGGFFSARLAEGDLIAPIKKASDGPVPAGNAVAVLALVRLARLTGDEGLMRSAEDTLRAFAGEAKRYPPAFAGLLCAFDSYSGPASEIAVVGPKEDAVVVDMLRLLRRHYIPNAVVAWTDGDEEKEPRIEATPLLEGKTMVGGRPAAYVCRDFQCEAPVTSVGELQETLAGM